MKISAFLAVLEKFWLRAQCFFPTKEFADEVKRLSNQVREALTKQLHIEFHTDDDLPPDQEIEEAALTAFEVLCKYLDEHDQGVGYWTLAKTKG